MIAKWAEKRSDEGRSVVNNAIVYSLSLAVYCTSWTYYGSVGKAANSGMMFLTIYLGPTLGVILWWVILKKLVVIKNEFRITSMADVISIRYGKSSALAVISTVACLIGITPYLALQLKAMVSTFNIIASGTGAGSTWLSQNIPILLVCWVIIFTIIFGARKLAPSERHEGIIAVLAVESIVKLVAFLGVGIFVAFFMYDGPLDILKKFSESKHQDLFKFGREGGGTYVMWMSYLILAMSAIMFLPRQFHVAVVENSNKNHIKTAMWLFPTYLFMINIFVVPIALGGLLAGVTIEQADSYVLRLPLLNEVNWLALFAFLGGFSAATGMIMISTMTLSTMASNHLILPFLAWFKPLSHLRKYILQIRWFAIVVIIFTGYMFFRFIGESYILVNMGMFSFAAVLQFAPVIIGGLFWHKGNRAGAILGLSAGFLVWFYTLLVPALVQSGWLPVELLNEGLLGMNWLRPRQLFNLEGFDPISHTVFWTMFFNIGLYVLGSLFFKQGSVELETADKFTRDSKSEAESTIEVSSVIDLSIPLNEKVDELKSVFGQYFPKGVVNSELDEVVDKAQLNKKKNISIAELGRLHERAEQRLAGTIGAATARVAM
ncbi:MAG: hypothetical protein HRT88_21395 [Lentisphaeraceae bacterium]|nr:hypothetical protein [Lentisphaeraceae bacterium]